MKQIVLVTGASSGFGRMIADALAAAGHTVYASMRGLSGGNAHRVEEVANRVKAALPGTVPDDADPAGDGAAVSCAVIDRVREQFLDRLGLADPRHPADRAGHG